MAGCGKERGACGSEVRYWWSRQGPETTYPSEGKGCGRGGSGGQGCIHKFCRGGVNLGYLKKRGAQLQAASGGALDDNVKKISLVILKGARLMQGGCPPPKYTRERGVEGGRRQGPGGAGRDL